MARKGSDVDEDGIAKEISADTRRLSRNPQAVRQRIRRNGGRTAEDIALLHEVTYGEVRPVSEWTLEELSHGRPRHPTGGWKGPKPRWLTPIIQAEVRKRLREETINQLVGHSGQAIKVLAQFLKNETEPTLRFKAAQLILEYTAGKPEQHVNVEANVHVQKLLAGALVLDDGTPAHPVIDGQAWESDEEDEDDDNAGDA